jgi:hypothetical protein
MMMMMMMMIMMILIKIFHTLKKNQGSVHTT